MGCDQVDIYRECDETWFISSIFTKNVPTWAAYNSMLTLPQEQTQCQCLPLIPSSPTDWSNLYTALKLAQGINTVVSPDSSKTIVTLDLQLYSMCVKLRERKDVYEGFIFRMGELHVVFAMLKVIGKLITDSGIESLFVEAGVYGPTTLGQIIDGKHYKRGMEAHASMYLAIKTLLLKEAVKDDEWNQICNDLSDLTVPELKNVTHDEISDVHEQLKTLISKSEVQSKIDCLKGSLQFQSKFFYQYLQMFEAILMFILASRQNLWRLHLSSLNHFVKYFFAFDQINYARLTPFYLATMAELETKDATSWAYLEENYSVVKTTISFVGIGSDHAMEQENKNLKIVGGIIGITQNPVALNRFCLAGPILNLISKEFEEKQHILREDKSGRHYQLKGAFNKRLFGNVEKILTVMKSFNVSFEASQFLANVVTKAVLPQKVAEEFLQHEKIGQALYNTFVQDRIQGEQSIWVPMK